MMLVLTYLITTMLTCGKSLMVLINLHRLQFITKLIRLILAYRNHCLCSMDPRLGAKMGIYLSSSCKISKNYRWCKPPFLYLMPRHLLSFFSLIRKTNKIFKCFIMNQAFAAEPQKFPATKVTWYTVCQSFLYF